MNLGRLYPATLLTPDERVSVLRTAQWELANEPALRGCRYSILAAHAAPNPHRGLRQVVVTVVLGRSLLDDAMLLRRPPDSRVSLVPGTDRVVIQYVDTARLFIAGRFSAGHPALSEELVTNPALNFAFEAFAAARGVTPAAMATLVEASVFRGGMVRQLRSQLTSSLDHLGETVLAGALLGEVDRADGLPFGQGSAGTLAAAAVDRIRALDASVVGRASRWLRGRLEGPGRATDLAGEHIALPARALGGRIAAIEQISSQPELIPEQARGAVVVATGGVRPLRPSMRALVIESLAAHRQPGAVATAELRL